MVLLLHACHPRLRSRQIDSPALSPFSSILLLLLLAMGTGPLSVVTNKKKRPVPCLLPADGELPDKKHSTVGHRDEGLVVVTSTSTSGITIASAPLDLLSLPWTDLASTLSAFLTALDCLACRLTASCLMPFRPQTLDLAWPVDIRTERWKAIEDPAKIDAAMPALRCLLSGKHPGVRELRTPWISDERASVSRVLSAVLCDGQLTGLESLILTNLAIDTSAATLDLWKELAHPRRRRLTELDVSLKAMHGEPEPTALDVTTRVLAEAFEARGTDGPLDRLELMFDAIDSSSCVLPVKTLHRMLGASSLANLHRLCLLGEGYVNEIYDAVATYLAAAPRPCLEMLWLPSLSFQDESDGRVTGSLRLIAQAFAAGHAPSLQRCDSLVADIIGLPNESTDGAVARAALNRAVQEGLFGACLEELDLPSTDHVEDFLNAVLASEHGCRNVESLYIHGGRGLDHIFHALGDETKAFAALRELEVVDEMLEESEEIRDEIRCALERAPRGVLFKYVGEGERYEIEGSCRWIAQPRE